MRPRRALHCDAPARAPPGQPVRLPFVALYAAYGSNMNAAQMALRCPHSPQRGAGWLDGWRLTFGAEDLGWEGALATVVEGKDDTARVFVVLSEIAGQAHPALDPTARPP